ncbi:MAG: DNA recombination/repair protein RecA [Candidatus Omnitrophica bacterium]|jgi:recombination protein RecA|nr:DNA recombination/repair protein RecA [Candidatus Omnitrophota bacterium]
MAKNVIAKGKPSQDDLASILSLHINKQLAKIGSSLYSFDDSVENPSDIKYWVSTGSTLLDLAIANRPNAGLPFGRIVEINSLEGAGKSLLCAHIIANTQKMGGIGIYIDTENAADRTFLNAVGVDTKAMLYTQLDTVEDIFDTIEQMILKVRESDKDKPLVIIVDSVSAATTKVESEADYSKDGWSTTKAIILSKAMRKMTLLIAKQKILLVLTSQLRQKLGAPVFAEQWTTSGGKAIPFHSSVRIRLKSVGQIKGTYNNFEQIVGVKTNAKVIKNRIGPPFRHVNFDIHFDSGVQDYISWFDFMIDIGMITKASGKKYQMVVLETNEPEGEEFTKNKFIEHILTDNEFRTLIYDKICSAYIMKYKPIDQVDYDGLETDELEENLI